MKTDILVVGAGIAGLSFACKMAMRRPDLEIVVITKSHEGESNTAYAQGGIAAVWDFETDNFQKHIDDTLDAGDGLCDEDVVKIVVEEGHERVKEIIEWGARFDKEDDNIEYDLGKEGGHSENRILHYKDVTGREIQRALIEKVKTLSNVKHYEHYFALDLITQHHLGYNVSRLTPNINCYGAYVLDKEEKDIETILARVTVLCTGGGGQIYRSTTNPVIATGDGIAMFYRAKGRIENMEFVQFHPTSFYTPAIEKQAFLVSEAVRGFGAILKTKEDEEFMHKYDERKSLAPRDIVARAIDNEMKQRGDEHLMLDCRHLDQEEFLEHFPNIYDYCKAAGVDAFKDLIPVVPAAHYVCGGVKTDKMGRSSINNLYACGECTSTGLHGANRLASNSLLEALVFSHRIHLDIAEKIDDIELIEGIPDWNARGTTEPKEKVLITQSLKELKEIMSSYVGIVRTKVRLKRAMDRLWLLHSETEKLYTESLISPQLSELRNLITIGYLVTRSAVMRRESRGLNYNTDFPDKQHFLEDSIL